MKPGIAANDSAGIPENSGGVRTLALCRLLTLPKKTDPNGSLTFIEGSGDTPFAIRRVSCVYDVPVGAVHGGQACTTTEQVVVALAGSFEVVLDDGDTSERLTLQRADSGLYIPSGIWHYLENFSTNAVCLILASGLDSEQEVVRDYSAYRRLREGDSAS